MLFGASTPMAKLLLGSIDPQMTAGLLYLGAGVGLGGLRLARGASGQAPAEAPLRRKDLPWLGLVILAGGLAGPLLLMLGLARTDASTASLLLNLEGLATMAIAWIVFRENVDRRLLAGAVAILAGAALLSYGGEGGGRARLGLGSVWIAGACLCWGIDNNLTRRLSAADPVQAGDAQGASRRRRQRGAGAAARGAATGSPPAGDGCPGRLPRLRGSALVLYVLALRHLGAARTGAYFSLAPFVGAMLALVLLRDPISAILLAAGALMAIGLWLHLSEHHEHDHLHDEMEHEHSHRHDEHHRHAHPPGVQPGEPHTHPHRHARLWHRHAHYPDLHHRHGHHRHHLSQETH